MIMARTVVVLDPAGFAKIDALADRCVGNVTDAVERDANRKVPVDTGELASSIHSLHTGDTGRVFVGTDHWAPTEYGSRPHIIRAHGDYALANRETGFYAASGVVNHPGTPEQAFMRPALYTKRRIRPGRA
jgi:hypothetical protein